MGLKPSNKNKMKYKIDNALEIETSISLKEIAEKIKDKVIDLNENHNLINWSLVWNVVILK